MRFSQPASLWLIPALIVAAGVILMLGDPFGWESRLAGQQFDVWQRRLPLAARHAVVMDATALDEDTLAQAVRALAGAGAAAIVLAAPPVPRPSPQSLILKLPPSAGNALRAALDRLPEPGAGLVAAAGHTPLVVGIMAGEPGHAPAARAKFIYRGTRNPFARVPHFAAARGAPDVLEADAAGLGAVRMIPDADGVVRRVPVAVRIAGYLMPSLAAETLRVLEKSPAITVTGDDRNPLTLVRGIGIARFDTLHGALPAGPDGRLWLRWTSIPRVQPSAPGDLRGKVAVIGPVGRRIATPIGPDSVAGVIANALNTMLAGKVPSHPPWIHLAGAVGLALLGAGLVLVIRRSLLGAAGLVLMLVPLLFLGGWLAFSRFGLLIDTLTPAITLALALAAGALIFFNQRRLIHVALQLAFAEALPAASIAKIARDPRLLTVDGQTRTITYLACGVRGLTDLAAHHHGDAPAFTRLVQLALSPLIDQALAHGGTIDRLTADGFTAFWNAPLEDSQHALHACEAASGMSIMSSRVTEQVEQEASRGGLTVAAIEIGVGLATGPVIAGGFGGHGRMGYSVSGEVILLAQRIQARSHQYGPSVIAASATAHATTRAFAWLEVDTIGSGPDPGMEGAPVTLYAMAGNPVMRASPKFRALSVFHDHIFQAIRRQQWHMARELIAQCRLLSGASGKMYDLHLARIAWYEKHPPGPDWDGAFRPPLK